MPNQQHMLLRRPRRARENTFYTRLVLSDEVLSKNVNAQESSKFCSLPCEILSLIWEDLSPSSTIVLMLTCKHFAEIGKLRGTRTPDPDDFQYFWLLSKLASWMPRSLKLCGKCRMYRMRATEQYRESDWRGLWLQEEWLVGAMGHAAHTNEIFICPLHRIEYQDLCTLTEVEDDLMPLPATPSHDRGLPSDGTGSLAVSICYLLNSAAHGPPRKENEPGSKAGVKRRRSF